MNTRDVKTRLVALGFFHASTNVAWAVLFKKLLSDREVHCVLYEDKVRDDRFWVWSSAYPYEASKQFTTLEELELAVIYETLR